MRERLLTVCILSIGSLLFLTLTVKALAASIASNGPLLPSDRTMVADDPNHSRILTASPPVCTYYFGFNTAKAPFTSELVRKAFIAAIDRPSLAGALGNAALPAMTFTPPGVFGHVNGFSEGVGVPFNPAQAQQWLANAGYPNGQGLPDIEVVGAYGVTGLITTNVTLQIAQANWHDNLNANVDIVIMEAGVFLLLLQQDPPQIWYLRRCTDQPDQQEADYYLHDGIEAHRVAFGNWQNTTYDNLLEQASGTPDLDSRKLLYKQAEEILVETDAVMLPMHYTGAAAPRLRVFVPIVLKNR